MEKKRNIISPHAGFQEKFVSSNVDVVFGGSSMGVGKEQPLDSLVLTPNGWARMGDIRVGDSVMTPFNGSSIVTGVFPQGEKDVYEIRFDDGRSCECGLEHLWAVRNKRMIADRKRNGNTAKNLKVATARELIFRLQCGERWWIPAADALEFPEKEYVIPPYALGVMLGDGCLTRATNDHGRTIFISNPEEDVRRKFAEITDTTLMLPDGDRPRCSFKPENGKAMRAYLIEKGLNCRSYDRYIPEEYLFGSIEQRKQLLFGLMDTDGCVQPKNRFSFTTTSERLRDGFIALCRSLGYVATATEDGRCDKYHSGHAWRVCVSTDDAIFSSEKHTAKYERNKAESNRKYSREKKHIRIVSIRKVRRAQCQCILIDDPMHLYVTDQYCVTHNSYGALLMAADQIDDPNFRMVFIRKNLGDTKVGGGGVDEAIKIYGSIATTKMSDSPRMTFPSGAFIDFTHMANQDPADVKERVKGWQYSVIYVDEVTAHEWSTIKILMSRNRSQARWSGKFRMTGNPEMHHWTRYWVDWYVDDDGYPIPERDGVVRYFYVTGDDFTDVEFGSSKREVYEKCRNLIDPKLEHLNQGSADKIYTYEDLIKSFTFLSGKLTENTSLLKNDPGYLASVAAMGEKDAQAYLMGCWNVSHRDDSSPIKSSKAHEIADNDPQKNGEMWLTVDLADTGTDNCIILAWDGLHITDCMLIEKSTPAGNCNAIEHMASKHGIGDDHIIYDAMRAAYMIDRFPMARGFISFKPATGVYKRLGERLKDVCYLRLAELVNNNRLSFAPELAMSRYKHANRKANTTFADEFAKECSVVNFDVTPSGKYKLWGKKAMNRALGGLQSMDLLDAIAMRMWPLCDREYGSELANPEEQEATEESLRGTIYDNTLWF